jgi:hypothetical protein
VTDQGSDWKLTDVVTSLPATSEVAGWRNQRREPGVLLKAKQI